MRLSRGAYPQRSTSGIADVWPLNPEGDLLAIPMIETAERLKNVDEIAGGALRGCDLHWRGGRT